MQKLKNNEPRPKFTGSYLKKAYISQTRNKQMYLGRVFIRYNLIRLINERLF